MSGSESESPSLSGIGR